LRESSKFPTPAVVPAPWYHPAGTDHRSYPDHTRAHSNCNVRHTVTAAPKMRHARGSAAIHNGCKQAIFLIR
jgi:hypothetical protein